MNKKITTKIVYMYVHILFLLSMCTFSQAQVNVLNPNKDSIDLELHLSFPLKNYYYQLNFLRENKEKYFNSSLRIEYLEKLATLNSFFGNYKEAIITKKQAELFENPNISNSYVSLKGISKFNQLNLTEYIDDLSDSVKIIILNEGHHVPQNRLTTLKLIRKLKTKGFNYFAIEALSVQDSLLNERKYALSNPESGYYINDPIFGDLIRQSLKIGYKLIPYEYMSTDFNKREKGQAENIFERIFKLNPNAKILIHCGYSHGLYENIDIHTMGYYLKLMTGKKPIFFEQFQLTEPFDSLYERKDYSHFHKYNTITEPTLFINSNKKLWKNNFTDGDGAIFTPKTILKNGRPTWLLFDNKKYYFPKYNSNNTSYPFLIQAFVEKEGEKSIPLDQIEIKNEIDNKALILYSGKYIIVALNKNGDEIFRYNIKIK